MSAQPVLIHRVIARLNVGGPAMHVVNLARALNDGPWRTRLIAGSVPPSEGDMSYYADAHGVGVTPVRELSREISPVADLRTLWRLYRLFRRERPRIVHTHTAKAGTLGRIAAVLARVPVRIHTFHGHVLGGAYFSPVRTRIFIEIERQLARFTSRMVVLTERQAAEMSGGFGVAPRQSFAVVPLGLNLAPFASVDRVGAGARARRALGIQEGALVVGIVGRLVAVKNHELFLAVIAELTARHEGPVVGLVVGGGDREGELRRRATASGLEGTVRWLGWRTDLPELYAAMDVLALTSHDEGTPVAVIEALATGTPVVARDVGGVGEVLEGCDGGVCVPRQLGPGGWAETLSQFARDALAAGTSESRVEVTRRFAVSRLAADLEEVYREELTRVGS